MCNLPQLDSSTRNLYGAFRDIERLAERMRLQRTIIEQAQKFYKDFEEQKSLKGRQMETVIAASLYMACRKEGVPRTIKEVCAHTTVPKKDVGRCFKYMQRKLELKLEVPDVSKFMVRFTSNLRLPNHICSVATDIAENAQKKNHVAGKVFTSVAAAAIFMASHLDKPETRRTQKRTHFRCQSIVTRCRGGRIHRGGRGHHPQLIQDALPIRSTAGPTRVC